MVCEISKLVFFFTIRNPLNVIGPRQPQHHTLCYDTVSNYNTNIIYCDISVFYSWNAYTCALSLWENFRSAILRVEPVVLALKKTIHSNTVFLEHIYWSLRNHSFFNQSYSTLAKRALSISVDLEQAGRVRTSQQPRRKHPFVLHLWLNDCVGRSLYLTLLTWLW
jgi:hypothetical protein